MSRVYIPNCRQSKGWVIYKAYKVIATSNEDDLNKKYISNRIKYPQHDLKQDEAIRQINLAVDDKILSLSGQNYLFGTHSFEFSDHDWYCYKCHDMGHVFKCSTCWRVYHVNCANFTNEQCTACEKLKQSQHPIRNEILSIERINEILKQILNRTIEDSKQIIPLSTIEGSTYNSVPIDEMKKIVFNYRINFNVIENKVNRQEYQTFSQFLYDCEDICHNLLVLTGPKGRIAKLVDRMFEAVCKDVDLANECLTCYRNFCDKLDPKYDPSKCTPSHEIAFIKYKSFPLWPCKLLSVNDGRYQGWFFGNPGNESIRALAKKKSVFTIEEAIKILLSKIQPAANFKTYHNALAEYDELMEKMGQSFNKVSSILIQKNGDSSNSYNVEDDEDAETPPGNFQLAMSDSYSGASLPNLITTQITTNGNTKSSDGISNLSFTFNGDSMNNSTSNPIDLDYVTLKNESRIDKISTPKNFTNLSSAISNGNSSSSFKLNNKRSNRSFISEIDIKEENKTLKRKLKESEDKIIELRQALKESYTKEYVENLNKEHKIILGDVKKKTWCRVCENEGFYYCCMNTFYCTIDCQLKDWWNTHKNQCFRKKQKKRHATEVKLN